MRGFGSTTIARPSPTTSSARSRRRTVACRRSCSRRSADVNQTLGFPEERVPRARRALAQQSRHVTERPCEPLPPNVRRQRPRFHCTEQSHCRRSCSIEVTPALRRAAGRRRREHGGRGRRAAGDPRPERSRQDHALQRHLRRLSSDLRHDLLSSAATSSRLQPHRRARAGIGRTYQNALLFDGLSVLDNLYLAVRGTRPRRFSLLRPRPGDPHVAAARRAAERCGSITCCR